MNLDNGIDQKEKRWNDGKVKENRVVNSISVCCALYIHLDMDFWRPSGKMRMVLKYLKETLKRDSLRPPHQKGIINYINRKMNPRINIPDRHISIFLTTKCNMNCFSCGALGMNPRPKVEHTKVEHIRLFLTIMERIHPNSFIMLTGGEPTLYPDLSEVCAMIHEHGFKTAMLTNGHKIVPIEWFDAIMLDYHGKTNENEIEAWKVELEGTEIIWDTHDKRYHQDIELAMSGNITKGLRCANLFEPLTLWKDVIYPCCNIMCLEWWHNDDSVTKALIDAGWTVGNDDFPFTLKNWRETLPSEFIRMCSLKCWRDSKVKEWRLI